MGSENRFLSIANYHHNGLNVTLLFSSKNAFHSGKQQQQTANSKSAGKEGTIPSIEGMDIFCNHTLEGLDVCNKSLSPRSIIISM